MPLKKIQFRPGVNKENTRYTNETGWYDSDKIRFRQGTPEMIGGWQPYSAYKYDGVCRALFDWITLGGVKCIATGTNTKYYVNNGSTFVDVTPIVNTTTGTTSFTATAGSSELLVSDSGYSNHNVGDWVTFSGAITLGGNITATVLNQEYQIIRVASIATQYYIDVNVAADASDTGHGGSAIVAEYQLSSGPEIQQPISGWGAGYWGAGYWGVGTGNDEELRIWSQSNYGEDLIFGPRYGGMYYWDASPGTARAQNLTSMPGAVDVPTVQLCTLVSDISRFVFAFGCNDYGDPIQDPMLIRWSDQEDAWTWTPSPTNQAGSLRLSHGSEISLAIQTRQEIFVATDSAVYALQYVGAPVVWSATLLSSNISSMSPNGAAAASNIIYWMGRDKFYKYDGTVQTLRCDLRRHIFGDINQEQAYQVFAGTNEAFNEIWWFYCSASSVEVDRYAVYNYSEDVWYCGTMQRTAWIDSTTVHHPIAATYDNTLVMHENGLNDNTNGVELPIYAYIASAEWDPDDGHNFSFMYRMLPDLTFRGSESSSPTATLTIIPLKNSGSGYSDPQSIGGNSYAQVTGTAMVPIEQFTGQVFIRVRGRQFVFKIESNQLDTTWQLGSPRIDIRSDGRR